ncbi:hypothetical protein ARALYDRAFT_889804 [Arabidopsis lyrata subsp. lyrata]|uniref:RRM domain-containing protein n=1 Tax=Arabidopsis lyrata subsp. lyrata TaxID=81972 RepID=D7KMK9_ARALL|nr:hypothetical protein ARALYDRAFT_889804 [Arabidopsis lyrata subsp. lyrata]
MAGGIGLGDTTYTKVFVGGLAWETHKETLKKHFEQFGEILEAVVITDKASGRSKGYGFVTFREAEAARRACVEATPVIDGRRANCNLASLGLQRSKPSTPNHGGGGRINNMRVMMSTMQTGFGPPPPPPQPPTFPHYPHLPLNLFGYSPYSPDYSSFPTNLYGMYGCTSGGQYGVYGNRNGGSGGLTAAAASAAPFYPCGGGHAHAGVQFSQPQPFYHHLSSYNPHHYSPLTISMQQGVTGFPLQPPLIPYR